MWLKVSGALIKPALKLSQFYSCTYISHDVYEKSVTITLLKKQIAYTIPPPQKMEIKDWMQGLKRINMVFPHEWTCDCWNTDTYPYSDCYHYQWYHHIHLITEVVRASGMNGGSSPHLVEVFSVFKTSTMNAVARAQFYYKNICVYKVSNIPIASSTNIFVMRGPLIVQ